jgi:hypothetical protein
LMHSGLLTIHALSLEVLILLYRYGMHHDPGLDYCLVCVTSRCS